MILLPVLVTIIMSMAVDTHNTNINDYKKIVIITFMISTVSNKHRIHMSNTKKSNSSDDTR